MKVSYNPYHWESNQPPFRRPSYLNNFMLLNMLGHLWLDGKECPWPKTDFRVYRADGGSEALDTSKLTLHEEH